jgi:hypothetical protein
MNKKKEFDPIAYKNKYSAEHYDRLNMLMPKGRKEELKKKAAAHNMSMSEYILYLVDNDTSEEKKF